MYRVLTIVLFLCIASISRSQAPAIEWQHTFGGSDIDCAYSILQTSDGGHNGLSSIIYDTGTDEFPRLRCGVGSDFHRGEQARYVLSKFKEAEKKAADEMIERAIVSCIDIVKLGSGESDEYY
jgi:hypothetical protein